MENTQGYDDREKAMAFRIVFGTDGKRSREQEIVWQEMVEQFKFYPTHQVVPGVGMDKLLAAYYAGQVDQAKVIFDNVTLPLSDIVAEPKSLRKEEDVTNTDIL